MGFLLRSVLPPIVVKQSKALITIDRITSKSKKKPFIERPVLEMDVRMAAPPTNHMKQGIGVGVATV